MTAHVHSVKDKLPVINIEPISLGGRRVYPIPEIGNLASVTEINKTTMGVWQEFLRNWYADTERRAIFTTVEQHHAWGKDLTGEQFVAMIEKHLGEGRAAIKEMEKAGDIGTAAHKMIRWHLRTVLGIETDPMPQLQSGASLAYAAWFKWWESSGYKPIAVEQVVWDKEHRYAGTVDCFAERGGKISLLDWKSSKHIYLEHHVQVAAYVKAAHNFIPVNHARIVRIPKSLDNIAIEDRQLGELYDPVKRKMFSLTYEQLLQIFTNNRSTYELIFER